MDDIQARFDAMIIQLAEIMQAQNKKSWSIKEKMFDRAFKRVNTFEDFRTELVEGKEKRARIELVQEITKKQKVEDDKETAELKQRMEIIPDDEKVAIDAIPLAVKSPIDLEPDEWIKDSGCSKPMTGNQKLFLSYKAYNGGQICDNKCRVTFSEHDSEITKDGKVIGRGIRKKGLYVMKLGNKPKDKICLATIDENSTLWHRRLGHTNMRLIQSLASKELVRNLPKLKFDQHFCDACKIGKQAHASHKAKNIVSMTRCLELLHMDLFGPSTVWSY
ncbi:retrovirus-related pol polyprotein from transposon TNT 1-94 [Tanacetum coccineum]